MEQKLFYLELSSEPIRFDAVSQLTNVFFDDSNRQVFAIRSGGATGCCVKGPSETDVISFCMEDKGPIRSIKFSPNNKILAIQRTDTSVDFVNFLNNQPQNDIVVYKGKNVTIHGFVWVHEKEVAVISNGSVEMVVLNMEKKQAKCLKSISMIINWFMWYSPGNLALLATNNGSVLMPVLLKQGTITKLPKLEPQSERGLPERDVKLAQIYGTFAILILRPTETRTLSVVIYLLNGPGLAPKKSHVLCLGHSGRFAINIVDDLIVVHHQATGTSMLFDIALSGETDSSGVVHHTPITPGRPIKPFSLKMPSLSFDGETKKCELYSPNWVIFQPNIVIDAKLGCMWYVNLNLNVLSEVMTDQLRLVELLLQRTHGKPALMSILTELVGPHYNNASLPVVEHIFDKLNVVYKGHVNAELQNQIAQPSFAKQQSVKTVVPPRVLIDQNDLHANVFATISETSYCNKLLMTYIYSLAKHKIAAQHDLSKMIIVDLVRHKKFDTLRRLIALSLLHESKPLACFLLSLSSADDSITQMALDMLHKLKANGIIVEVLLGQGKIIDALRLAKSLPGEESTLSARKYLEAAIKGQSWCFMPYIRFSSKETCVCVVHRTSSKANYAMSTLNIIRIRFANKIIQFIRMSLGTSTLDS